MRVIYFSRGYSPHDHRFLSALAKSPHQVFFLRLERNGRDKEDRPLPENVEQIQWAGGTQPVARGEYLTLLSDLRRVIHRYQPDLIHAGPVQTVAILPAMAGFKPLVTMSWGSDLLLDADRSLGWRWSTRFTLDRTSVLVGDCEAVRRKAAEFGFPAERVVLFPWGVDLQHFSPGSSSEFRARLGWENEFVLLSTRTWEPLYGVDLLVRAFVHAARQIPNLRLILLGSGSQSGLIHQIVQQYEMVDRVFMGGQVGFDELPAFYRAADLYLSASHSDGSSVSLMEALACGLPALVSDIPGNQEWINDGQQGWLFPDGSEQALVEKILAAYRQRDRLREVGRASRRLAEERANWPRNVQKLFGAYEMAMKV